MKKALITGITGQDGSYLAELLLGKGYEVHGIIRRNSTLIKTRIDHLVEHSSEKKTKLHLHYGDLTDSVALIKLLFEIKPDEIYNLGAQSHVRISFDVPEYTLDTTGTGAGRILEAIRDSGLGKEVRYYQASSSEMFGKVQEVPQKESTPFWPRSPYACAKVMAHWLAVNYRESYGLFACSGILFNHESPRRGENFVTRKISLGAAKIKHGLQNKLYLGNLDAKRDWGYAPEYVEGMWRMLQQDAPADYVLATGETHSIRDFLEASFSTLDLDWQEHVEFDPQFLRPAEVDLLIGDASKAKAELGWEAQTKMAGLAEIMTKADYDLIAEEK
ncbi:MAG: GDP-mannose 4,6-dehydratase [Verrucomicrobiota bacterium]